MRTIDWIDGAIELIDQTLLPQRVEVLRVTELAELIDDIQLSLGVYSTFRGQEEVLFILGAIEAALHRAVLDDGAELRIGKFRLNFFVSPADRAAVAGG